MRQRAAFAFAAATAFLLVYGLITVSNLNLLRSIYGKTSQTSVGEYTVVLKQTASSNEAIEDSEGVDCAATLEAFRVERIGASNTDAGHKFTKSYVTLTDPVASGTAKPFYVAVHSGEIDAVRQQIFNRGSYYETALTQHIADVFDSKRAEGAESIMLDVGGNVGWFSLVAAAHGATKVYTFEPNARYTVRFCESLLLNGWAGDVVTPVRKGVGKKNEQMEFHLDMNNPGESTFQKAEENNKRRKVGDLIDLITLDSFADQHGWFESRPSIGFLKIDVEHFEAEAIEGARKLLGAGLIEYIAMELKHDHSNDTKTFIVRTLVKEANYELIMHGNWLGPNKEVTTKYDDWKDLEMDFLNNKFSENLLFRHKNVRSQSFPHQ